MIIISVAPQVSTKAALVGAVENRPFMIVCEAKAYPKAMVEWMRSGKSCKSSEFFSLN